MSRKEDINALLHSIEIQYAEIESAYNKALGNKEVPFGLKIKIKNFFDNARSILDYLAHDIAEKLNITATKIYFPIVKKNSNIQNYKGFIGRHLPNLQTTNQKLFNYIESLQPYQEKMGWLADFAEINNNSKHQQLTPQTRIENPSVNISHNNVEISLTGGASIVTGSNTLISLDGAVIPGGQQISANSNFVGDPRLQVKREIWVSFLLNGNINALNLLKKMHDEFPKIVSEVYRILEL